MRRSGIPGIIGNAGWARARAWTFLGAHIAPEARWAMVLERPPEKGWRHGALEAIGGHERDPAVRAASRTLLACRALRDQMSAGEAVSADAVAALLDVAGTLEPPRSRLRFKAT